jgi:hypothetical protein
LEKRIQRVTGMHPHLAIAAGFSPPIVVSRECLFRLTQRAEQAILPPPAAPPSYADGM